ncbi:MAG: HAD-IB family hydrolase [Actinomycetota bacterium]|jgi:phosphatidylglycerophosphatase C|nr:HAD-IB family hydrolase [Actinomycetota bacterium]
MSSPLSRTETEGSPTGVPTVAAFDFDGTITSGGSVMPFLIRVRGFLPVTLAALRTLPLLLRAALLGGESADRAKEALFSRLLAGLPSDQVDAVASAFAAEHLARRLRPEVRERMDLHRSLGHRLVVVSASPECYVRVAGELLGVEAVLATRLQEGGGLLTGHFEGRNCRGAEKYARLTGWLRAEGLHGAGLPQPVLWAYGNSRGDLRLLSAADHGIDAGRLGRLGRLRRFPRLGDPAVAPRA